MSDDVLRQLAQIQQDAAGMQTALVEALATASQRTEGGDPSGAVCASLGSDGLPEAFRVEAEWDRLLAPAAFSGAVVAASRVAMGTRLAVAARLLADKDQPANAAQERENIPAQRATTTSGSAFGLVGPEHDRDDVTPRSLGQLAEDMIKALDTVIGSGTPPLPASSGTGVSSAGKLSMTFSPAGVVSCVADPRWVSTKTGASLTRALCTALGAARADLAKNTRIPPRTDGLDRHLDEALAILNDPQRLTDF